MKSRAFISVVIWLAASVCCAEEFGYIRSPITDVSQTPSVSEFAGPYQSPPDAQLVWSDSQGVKHVLLDKGALNYTWSLDAKTILASQVVGPGNTTRIVEIVPETGVLTELVKATPGIWMDQVLEHATGLAWLDNRDNWRNPHEVTNGGYQALTVWGSDRDGRHVDRVWDAGQGGLMGLSLSKRGRLLFATGENQGTGQINGLWGNRAGGGTYWSIWEINPDGSDFQPRFSEIGMQRGTWQPGDWPTDTPFGLVFAMYYDALRYGTLRALPYPLPPPFGPGFSFGPAIFNQNPPVIDGRTAISGVQNLQFAFTPPGMYSLTPWSAMQDSNPLDAAGNPLGLVSHPWVAPGDAVTLTYTGPNWVRREMVNGIMRQPKENLGVYIIRDIKTAVDHPSKLEKLVDTAEYHEWFGKVRASFRQNYGGDVPTPVMKKAPFLPPGSPYCAVGSSDVGTFHESARTAMDWEGQMMNWTADDVEYLCVGYFSPSLMNPKRWIQNINGDQYPNFEGFKSAFNEREGWFADLIPLKKWLTPTGTIHYGPNPPSGSTLVTRGKTSVDDTVRIPDTSFLCEFPANQSVTFAWLDKYKKLWPGAKAPTWHAPKPEELNNGCHGCHAHHNSDPLEFEDTFAARPDYAIKRLKQVLFSEYRRDIAPLGLNKAELDAAPVLMSAIANIPSMANLPPEKQFLVNRWIDTGKGEQHPDVPFDSKDAGFLLDNMRPTVNDVVLFDREANKMIIHIGMADPHSGLDMTTFKVTLAGKNITEEFVLNPAEDVWTRMGTPEEGELLVEIADKHGNWNRQSQTIGDPDTLPDPPPEPEPEPLPITATYVGKDKDEVSGVRSKEPGGGLDHHVVVMNPPDYKHVTIKADGTTPYFEQWSDFAAFEDAQFPQGKAYIIDRIPRPGSPNILDMYFADVSPPGGLPIKPVYIAFWPTEDMMTPPIKVQIIPGEEPEPEPEPAPEPDDCAELQAEIDELRRLGVLAQEQIDELKMKERELEELKAELVRLGTQ